MDECVSVLLRVEAALKAPSSAPSGHLLPKGRRAACGALALIIGDALPLSPSGGGRGAMSYGRVLFSSRRPCPRWRVLKSFGRTGEGELVVLRRSEAAINRSKAVDRVEK